MPQLVDQTISSILTPVEPPNERMLHLMIRKHEDNKKHKTRTNNDNENSDMTQKVPVNDNRHESITRNKDIRTVEGVI